MTLVERETVSAFTPSFPFPIGTYKERPLEREFERSRAQGFSAPLWTIFHKTKQHKVSKPIKVRIYFEDNLFFAENETLVVIGTGSSVTEAIDDLCKHIVHFHNYYKKLSRDKVTGDAIRLKTIYETLFIEQG